MQQGNTAQLQQNLAGAKKRIYIAGKVTGEENLTLHRKFIHAQHALQNKGFDVVNPLIVVGNSTEGWKADMRKCIAAMLTCDAVYCLPCWVKSRGATLERFIAGSVGIEIIEADK